MSICGGRERERERERERDRERKNAKQRKREKLKTKAEREAQENTCQSRYIVRPRARLVCTATARTAAAFEPNVYFVR